MAITRRLQDFRLSARQCADLEAVTDRFPDSEWNDYVNRALGALYRKLTAANPSLRFLASVTIALTSGTTIYAIVPTDFRSLISVELVTSNVSKWLDSYEFVERPNLLPPVSSGCPTAYRLQASNIEFLPTPTTGYTAKLWYVPTAPQLASDPATADVLDRLDDYIIWWAAREALFKEKKWDAHDRLSAKLAEIEGDILILGRSYDLNKTRRPRDVYNVDRYGRATRR